MLKKFRRAEQGQALVELALVLPVLIMLAFGIIEFGRVFNAYLVVNQSAREGARQGIVGATDSEIITAVNNSASTLNTANLTITITPSQTYRIRGASLAVSVKYPVSIYIPLLSAVIPNPLDVNGKTVMRVE